MDLEATASHLERRRLHFICSGYLRRYGINPRDICRIIAVCIGPLDSCRPQFKSMAIGDVKYYNGNVSSKIPRIKTDKISEIWHVSDFASRGKIKSFDLSQSGEHVFATLDSKELHYSTINKNASRSSADILYSVKLTNGRRSLQFSPFFTNGLKNVTTSTYWNGKAYQTSIVDRILGYKVFGNGDTMLCLVNYTNSIEDDDDDGSGDSGGELGEEDRKEWSVNVSKSNTVGIDNAYEMAKHENKNKKKDKNEEKKNGIFIRQELYGIGFYNFGQWGVDKSIISQLNCTRRYQGVQYVSYPKQIHLLKEEINPNNTKKNNSNNNNEKDFQVLCCKDIIKNVSMGLQNTIFLTDDGNCYGCGKYDRGQCGVDGTKIAAMIKRYPQLVVVTDSKMETIYAPLKLHFKRIEETQANEREKEKEKEKKEKEGNEIKIEKVVCGDFHTLCLEKNNHNIWIFGCQNETIISEPTLVNQIDIPSDCDCDLDSIDITDDNKEFQVLDIEANKSWSVIMDNMFNIYISNDVVLTQKNNNNNNNNISKEYLRSARMIIASKIELSRYVTIPRVLALNYSRGYRYCKFNRKFKRNLKIKILCNNKGFVVCVPQFDAVLNIPVLALENLLTVNVNLNNINNNKADSLSVNVANGCDIVGITGKEWKQEKYGEIVNVLSRGNITTLLCLNCHTEK